jgi:Skp family chaperone for outer membrane proteins
MKRLLVLLASVLMMSASAPAFAASPSGIEGVTQCSIHAESIQQTIKRLQANINEGKKVYTAEELKRIENKLKEARELLEEMASR